MRSTVYVRPTMHFMRVYFGTAWQHKGNKNKKIFDQEMSSDLARAPAIEI